MHIPSQVRTRRKEKDGTVRQDHNYQYEHQLNFLRQRGAHTTLRGLDAVLSPHSSKMIPQ